MKQIFFAGMLLLTGLLVNVTGAAQTKKPAVVRSQAGVKKNVKTTAKQSPEKKVQPIDVNIQDGSGNSGDAVEIGHAIQTAEMAPPPPVTEAPKSAATALDTVTYKSVEVEAGYPDNWPRFLERNLRFDMPQTNGPKPGTYAIKVEVIIDQNGSLKNSQDEFYGIRSITSFGFGMEDEAVRVIKKSKAWKPAQLNGRPVKAYKTVTITYIIPAG